jgi:hypothetical protein
MQLRTRQKKYPEHVLRSSGAKCVTEMALSRPDWECSARLYGPKHVGILPVAGNLGKEKSRKNKRLLQGTIPT